MNPAVYDQTSVEITAKDYMFRASGRVLKFDGFLKVYEETATRTSKTPEDEEDITLPASTQGETLSIAGNHAGAAFHGAAAAIHRSFAGEDARREGHRPAVDLRDDSLDDPGSRVRPEGPGQVPSRPNSVRS